MALRTDYKNAVFSGKRKYHLIENEDGTVSLLDATQYSQTGDRFGAKDVNAIGTAVNGLADSIGDAFSEERAYAVGEYAIYENILYEFTAAKAAGPWEPDAATPTTIAEVVRELNGYMTGILKFNDYVTPGKSLNGNSNTSFTLNITVPPGYKMLGTVSICGNYPDIIIGDVTIKTDSITGYMHNTISYNYTDAKVKARVVYVKI